MGTFSIWHWLIVLLVFLLLFGKGRVPEFMADLAKGIKSFKKGMMEDSEHDDSAKVDVVQKSTVKRSKKKSTAKNT